MTLSYPSLSYSLSLTILASCFAVHSHVVNLFFVFQRPSSSYKIVPKWADQTTDAAQHGGGCGPKPGPRKQSPLSRLADPRAALSTGATCDSRGTEDGCCDSGPWGWAANNFGWLGWCRENRSNTNRTHASLHYPTPPCLFFLSLWLSRPDGWPAGRGPWRPSSGPQTQTLWEDKKSASSLGFQSFSSHSPPIPLNKPPSLQSSLGFFKVTSLISSVFHSVAGEFFHTRLVYQSYILHLFGYCT
ncbi:hypothetical protein GGI43DRAFT_258156 [Trichoderma evansii]